MKSLPRFLPSTPFTIPLLWLAFVAWLGFLSYVSSQPPLIQQQAFIPQQDKILHFGFFACGALTLGAALRATIKIRWTILCLVALISLSALGLADEINQIGIPGRSGGDQFDWLADFVGAVCGLLLLRTFYGQRSKYGSTGFESPGTDSKT